MQSQPRHFRSHVWKLHRNIDRQAQIIGRGARLRPADVYAVERAIIQLQIEWERFVRTFILDCATGFFVSHGRSVTSSLRPRPATREKAGHLLVGLYPRRNREPAWHLPKEAIGAANKLDLSNRNDISAVLGVAPWRLDDLRYLRNYIAHQSKQSALELRKNGIITAPGSIMPACCALSYANDGVQRYIGWSRFMKAISQQLVG